jgi:hypothetical protein
MSVISSKRGASKMEFLNTALDLEVFTLKTCLDFSKRYTFLMTNEIADLSKEIFNNVKRANSIYPVDRDEAKLRRRCFILAYGDCQCLITQIQVAYDLKMINSAKYERLEKDFREKEQYKTLSEEERKKKFYQRKLKLDQQRDNLVEEWMNMLDKEMELIKAIMASDKKRYKNLPK